jgi:hypothetical protein
MRRFYIIITLCFIGWSAYAQVSIQAIENLSDDAINKLAISLDAAEFMVPSFDYSALI